MKRSLLTLALVLFNTALSAANVEDPRLETYLKRTFPLCPDAKVSIERVEQQSPAGFLTYRGRLTSSDSRCGDVTYALVSPSSGQTLVVDVVPLQGIAPVETEITDFAKRALKKQAIVTFEPAALPDQLRKVKISMSTPYGIFALTGYVDASNKFLLVGRRGDQKTDPGKSLLESLGVANAATKGKKNSKITIVELSDFQCPTCKKAHAALGPLLKKNLSKISYSRLDLPLFESHDWSLSAAMGSRAIQRVAPGKYWAYVDYIFANQSAITAQTIDAMVRDFCDGSEISWDSVRAIYSSKSERQKLLDQVGRIYDAGIASTPTYIVNGQIVYYGSDGEFLRKHLESVLKTKAK